MKTRPDIRSPQTDRTTLLRTNNVVIVARVNDVTLEKLITVLPEDTSKLIIQPDNELCTLVTCTPYGVNTHRLLVRGVRIANEQAEYVDKLISENDEAIQSTWQQEYFKGIGLGLAGLFIVAVVLEINRIRPKRRRKRGRHEQR